MLKLQVKDFDIRQTLECGQTFRFKNIDGKYLLQTKDIVAIVCQQENYLFIESTFEDEDFWNNYFDLYTDYKKIKDYLSKDEIIRPYIAKGSGIHILRQDFNEMLISFIISQNKQIPQIKQCVELYSKMYGKKISFHGQEYYGFPVMPDISEEGLKNCKVGFRDKYIIDAIKKQKEGFFANIYDLPCDQQYNKLTSVKGIGPKVANCILLFALKNTNSFPVDVWIKRVFEKMYFDGKETSKETIQKKAAELYGEYAGYAQQYIFFGRK